MSVPGGGDITELLRRLGEDALVHEAQSAGIVRGKRTRCPWKGCEHKKDRDFDTQIGAGKHGHFRIFCHACGESGDLVDLLQRTRNWSQAEAIAHIKGTPVPERPRPELRVVGSRPPDEAGKMEPGEVKRLWESLAVADAACHSYLEGRKLGDVVESGLVRFVQENTTDKRLSGRARSGYRIAALTSDVVGQPRGLQLRLARPTQGHDEMKIVSVKGSVTSRAFFGQPGLIEASPVIAVCEGLPDTLAVQLWTDEQAVVVGAAGKGAIRHLASELEAAGIDITGKLFLLFPQNDRPKNESRVQFDLLRTALLGRGARTEWVRTPDVHADVADWWKAKAGLAWPPPEVQAALGKDPGDESEPLSVLPKGVAVPIPTKFESKSLAQDFTTLCMLLDDSSYRETIFNSRGELSFNEMTTRVRWGEHDTGEVDLSTVRHGLERIPASNNGKPLKFNEGDIEKAMMMCARRKTVHPVRDWLSSLTWDGKQRLESELPLILGHEAHGFDARLLRRWMVSAVARAMEPGCKVDTCLILLGKTRTKKSTFFDVLGGQWFTDADVVPGDKDSMLKLREVWIVEWGELEGMKRSRSAEATKKFLSTKVDLFRSPYGKDTRKAPRHCVFVGTTNEEEIFTDPRGNFRFWPIEVKAQLIDVRWLAENRDQLFAEAATLYAGGKGCPTCLAERELCGEHRWWLTDDEDVQLGLRNKRYEMIDAWQSNVLQYLDENRLVETVRIEWILGSPQLKLTADQLTPGAQQRVGRVLRHLDWVPEKQKTEHGGWENVWRRPVLP